MYFDDVNMELLEMFAEVRDEVAAERDLTDEEFYYGLKF